MIGFCMLCTATCFAQPPPRFQPAQPSAPDSIFMPADRSILLLLERTGQLLDESRYAEAVRCLDAILGGREDYFFRTEGEASVHRSIKSEARRLIGLMPSRGRESYELSFGTVARTMLDEAVETGDVDLLAEIARRYFHTEAGYEAAFLLGLHHADHGRPLVGALTLRRLRDESLQANRFEPALSLSMARCWLEVGMPEPAGRALDQLRDRYADTEVKIQEGQIPLCTAEQDSVQWLLALLGPGAPISMTRPTDWRLHGGAADRNAVAQGSAPLFSRRWRIPTTDHPGVEAMIEQIRRQQEDRETTLLPGLRPLVVGNVVLMRTVANLLAVDADTGKRLWEVPVEDPFEAAMNPPPETYVRSQTNLESGMRLRLWGDAAFGTLASDGQLVFAVEDLQLPTAAIYSRVLLAPGNRNSSTGSLTTYNRLAAYDIQSQGKLSWELGGPRSENELPLAGAFFLGPPLPLLGDLYVLAEIDGEVRLIALEADSGNVLWQQQLAIVDQSVFHDTLRRVSGVSPSYADGILVCPTSHHSVVALELTTRSLLWGHGYAEAERNNQQVRNLFGTVRRRTANPEDRWVDSSLIVADGRILATPVDSEQLHCLSLHDGKLLWRVPREDKLYVAAVSDGRVLVVGRGNLTVLRLDDGKSLGVNEFAAGSAPSGRGFFNGESYFLPLTGGKLMSFRLRTGQVEEVLRSRDGATLGNLVCHEGKLLSQRADGVESFHQLEALRAEVANRLAEEPDDAGALAYRGQILWSDGRLDEAAENLRRSLQIADSVHTRSLLRDVLFAGLETDFANYQRHHDEVASLVDTIDERAKLHRLMATGWEQAGRYDDALARYRLLIDPTHEESVYVDVAENHLLRQDRWIQSRLSRIHATAPPDVRRRLEQWVANALEQAGQADDTMSLTRALRYVDGLPGAEQTRLDLVERLVAAGRLSEAELSLMNLVRGDDGATGQESMRRWATLLATAGRPTDAAVVLDKAENALDALSAADGENVRRWIGDLEKENESVRQARVPGSWPKGHVKTAVAEVDPAGPMAGYGRWPIPFQSRRGMFFRDLALKLHQSPQQLLAQDGLGRVQWKFRLDNLAGIQQLGVSRSLWRVDACGHLLILAVGNRIIALDTLKTKDDGTPTVAWIESVGGIDADAIRRQMFRNQMRNSPGLIGIPGMIGSGMNLFGTAVVVNENLICLKRSRSCVALDAVTGQVLWQRENISSRTTIFGDDESVILVPPRSVTATVLRAADGTEMTTRGIPPEEQRLAIIGRRLLCWQPKGHEYLLTMLDPAMPGREGTVWGPIQFEVGSKVHLFEREAIAVLTPNGRFKLIRLADGETIVDARLDVDEKLTDILVLRRGGRWVLIVNNGVGRSNPKRRVSQVVGVTARRMGDARLHIFDSKGKPLLEKPTPIEDHYLPLVQPTEVPCVTFACNVQEYAPNRPNQPKIDILCVDVRNGAVVFDQEFAQASHTLDIVGSAEEATAEIRMQSRTVTLQFTDEPIPEVLEEPVRVELSDNRLEEFWRAVTDEELPAIGKKKKAAVDPTPRVVLPPIPMLQPAARDVIVPAQPMPDE